MFQSMKSSSLNDKNDAILDSGPAIYLSFFLIIVFFFLFEPLLCTSPHSHGFYFASTILQNLIILLEILLPSISIFLLLKAPRTICNVFALWLLIPSNFIYLFALLVFIFSANSSLDKLSINQFDTSTTLTKPLGNITMGMSSVPIPYLRADKGEPVLFTRLWIERPVFSGIVREYKILVAKETVEAKLLVQEKERNIQLLTRNFFGQPGEHSFNSIDWNSVPD